MGAIDLVNAIGVEPAALAQASAVIASSAMSCQGYQEYFVRWREYLADSAGALPLASAVTWPVSLESATQFAPGGSVRSLLALAALLDGHGIPATVLTAPAAVRYLTDADPAEGAEGAEPALAALAALERVGLLTVERASAPPTVRMSPVLQAALRDAIPDAVLDQARPGRRGRTAAGLACTGTARLARFRSAVLHRCPPAGGGKPAVGRQLASGAATGRRQPGSRSPDRAGRGALA